MFGTGPPGPAERAERQRGVLASRVVGASRQGGVGVGLVGAGQGRAMQGSVGLGQGVRSLSFLTSGRSAGLSLLGRFCAKE